MRTIDVGMSFRNFCAAFGLVAMVTPSTVLAHPYFLFAPQSVTMIGSSKVCAAFLYDANGNRILRTASTSAGGAAVWGSASFGCFSWGQ